MVLREIIEKALLEDRADEDITSLLFVPENKNITFTLIAKESGILSGVNVFKEVFHQIDPKIMVTLNLNDGENFKKDDIILSLSGNAQKILSGERTAINFLAHLSGIATACNQLVGSIPHKKITILDTRKTTPLLRILEKQAVIDGGGTNHRLTLADTVLIKDNHIASIGEFEKILKKIEIIKSKYPELFIEIEIENLNQLKKALNTKGIDRIMLDNFTPELCYTAVNIRKKMGCEYIPFEISGGISKQNIEEYSNSGCEFISIGSITHSSKAIDFSLKVEL